MNGRWDRTIYFISGGSLLITSSSSLLSLSFLSYFILISSSFCSLFPPHLLLMLSPSFPCLFSPPLLDFLPLFFSLSNSFLLYTLFSSTSYSFFFFHPFPLVIQQTFPFRWLPANTELAVAVNNDCSTLSPDSHVDIGQFPRRNPRLHFFTPKWQLFKNSFFLKPEGDNWTDSRGQVELTGVQVGLHPFLVDCRRHCTVCRDLYSLKA